MRDVVRVALRDLVAEFSPDGVPAFLARVDDDEVRLTRIYRAIGAWPADAQFALHVTAWVVGPGAPLPDLRRAVNRSIPDFRAAAEAMRWSDGGHAGVIALRDKASRAFRNAAVVLDRSLDPDRLFYPTTIDGTEDTRRTRWAQ